MFQRWIYNRLQVPERAERVRPKGTAQMTSLERQFDYLRHTTPKRQMNDKQRAKLIKKIERLANWLDNAVPGSPIPLGLDSLLSFIPFFGAFAGAIFTLYQIYLSTLFGIPLWLLLRMMISLVIDAVIGTIPVVGAFLDMFYKANLWNYEALQDYLDHMDMAAANAAASSTGPTTTTAGSSASAATSKRYQDIATTEISWAQLIYDARHLGTTLIAWINPTSASNSKMNK